MSYAPRETHQPRDPSTIQQEPTGPIASDSLAADSINEGGEFSSNADAVALGVKGANSTLANEDTSGATKLAAAATREDRLGNQPEQSERYPDDGYVADSGVPSATGSSAGVSSAGARPFVDAAPTYTSRVAGNVQSEGELQPKGEDLVEEEPTTKTTRGDGGEEGEDTMGDVGGPNDPGRLAEKDFEGRNIEDEDEEGGGGKKRSGFGAPKRKGNSEGMFDSLSSERA